VLEGGAVNPTVVDLFAGPGGWSEGLRLLGLAELGIEIDATTCDTARLAGHRRLCADVAECDPAWLLERPAGVIASPPCPGFSTAGKRRGRDDVPLCEEAARRLARGDDARATLAAECADGNSMLVVEPLRWALELRPEWIACEQVPSVLPLWELFAALLASEYSTWTGIVNAANYGVPQTRDRAIFLASRIDDVRAPAPTHADARNGLDAFGLPAWLSMADALGWPPDDMVGFPRRNDRPNGRSNGSGAYRARDRRPASLPAFNLTEKARSWTRLTSEGDAVRVDVDEAAILQGFRHGYPWQGSRTAQFHQIGNAVPPPMARALLGPLVNGSNA
jgi:DNA (cytosine-5)-methyltransferase 1